MTALTFGQIRAQVAAIRKQHGKTTSRVYGIQTKSRYAGQEFGTIGEDRFQVVQCQSELALRVALQEAHDADHAIVLLTDLSTEQLSTDIRVRLARRKVYAIKKWQVVKEMFEAKSLDPRISSQNWIAERLLELGTEYPPVPGGVLDAETVWTILLDREIGLSVVHPDLIGLLKWSMDEENVTRFASTSAEFQEAAAAWISQSCGVATSAVLTSIGSSGTPVALPIGLALGVVGHPSANGEVQTAKVRIEERYVSAGKLTTQVMLDWQKAATTLIRFHLPNAKARNEWLSRGDDLLNEVGATASAYLSSTSPKGFEQRLNSYGEALNAATSARVTDFPIAVRSAYDEVLGHNMATWQRNSRRMDRVRMSARLLRWLAADEESKRSEFASLGQAATWYASEGAFVDWARYTLQSGEPARKLAEAYTRLVGQVRETRSRQNRCFGELVRDWTAAGATSNDVLAVERVLSEYVAPLAAHGALLVLLMDGMSHAVFRELVSDITRQDWVEIRRADKDTIWSAIATIPSITEVSRTSLFCGELRQGNQNTEKADFPKHPDLLRHSQTAQPPILFHKNELQSRDETTLSKDVIKALESKRRIVGAVVNAVDDFLMKGEQLDIRWRKDEIKVLPQLLYEARSAGRMVVLLSDHGHVLDRETTQNKHEGGERWRHTGTTVEGELAVSGNRCVIPDSHELIVPWSEEIRYGIKKNGYHGGITMQEMLAPMAVLSARDDLPEGWIEPPDDTPPWWFEPVDDSAPAKKEQPVETAPASPPPGHLFDRHEYTPEHENRKQEPTEEQAKENPVIPDWISLLFDSSAYKAQKTLAGRKPPNEELVRKLLVALSEQGGKLTSTALARRMNVPAFRLSTTLAAIQRLLNVEGYSILSKDEASDSIMINVELLCTQFEIESGDAS